MLQGKFFRGNCLEGIILGGNSLWAGRLEDNFPGGISWGVIVRGAVVQGRIIQG